MFELLGHRTFRYLFLAQVSALIGTGLATVALSLLAFELAEEKAGTVIGTALALKMAAYVIISPVASAFLRRFSRRSTLITLDLLRAATALLLPFVTEVWHVYLLILLLQACSAAFTPLFQATIPETLPDEVSYTRALSLSRVAYDLENLLSPMLVALLLTVVSWQGLFGGTVLGFLASATLIAASALSLRKLVRNERSQRFGLTYVGRGIRFYMATPRLKGLFLMNLAVAAAGSMVLVNTVVIVQSEFMRSETFTALAFASFGAGSLAVALFLPRLLDRFSERSLMLLGHLLLILGLSLAALMSRYEHLLLLWCVIGAGYAFVQTPAGRLITRSSHSSDRPDLFAAQFSLSHLGWLFAYPVAGYLAEGWGMSVTFLVFAGFSALAWGAARQVWPKSDPQVLYHVHDDLPEDHPHISSSGRAHQHRYVVDDLHLRWPR